MNYQPTYQIPYSYSLSADRIHFSRPAEWIPYNIYNTYDPHFGSFYEPSVYMSYSGSFYDPYYSPPYPEYGVCTQGTGYYEIPCSPSGMLYDQQEEADYKIEEYQLAGRQEDVTIYEGRLKRNYSRSSYIIALMDRSTFIQHGGKEISAGSRYNGRHFEVYHIYRMYDGSAMHETCALIGIRLQDWNELLITNGSALIQYMRESPDLQHIQDIHNLNTHIQDYLFRFRYAFRDIVETYNPDDLILFNIEPRGNGRLEKSYPVPLITIPGGGMEVIDNQSYEQCGIREFREETGIDISHKHVRIHEERIVRKKNRRYVSSSYHIRNRIRREESPQEYSNVSMFYLVRIV